MNTKFLLVLFISSLALSHAWWCVGHMLVAAIASNTMCPGTARLVNELIQPESKYNPKSPDSIQGACWADDIKPTNPMFEKWHYSNLPLVDRTPPNDMIPAADPTNVLWAIEGLNKTMHARKEASPSDVARAVYFLTHFFGDLHQPLHVVTLFSQHFEHGDKGGNEYQISYGSYHNLHAFWDSGADQWADDPERPLSRTDYGKLNSTAASIMQQYPKANYKDRLKSTHPKEWAMESYQIAKDLAYTAPTRPTSLPKEYVSQAQDACGEQVAIGGYRLAAYFESVLGCIQ